MAAAQTAQQALVSEAEQKVTDRERFLAAVRGFRAGGSSDGLWTLYKENVIDNDLYLEAVDQDNDEDSGDSEAYMLRCFDICREKMQQRKEERASRQRVLDDLSHPNQALCFPFTDKLHNVWKPTTYNILYLPRMQIAASHKEAWQADDELFLSGKNGFKIVNLTEPELKAVHLALNMTLNIDLITKERDSECHKFHHLLA